MVPLLQDPTGSGWDKTVGLTVYPRCPREVGEPREDWEQNSCIHSTEAADFGWMGYSMRIDHSDGCSYRFTMWPRWNGSALQPIWSDVRAVELYNHTDLLQPTQSDFDSYENKNLANHGLPFWQPRGPETPLVAVMPDCKRQQQQLAPPSTCPVSDGPCDMGVVGAPATEQ